VSVANEIASLSNGSLSVPTHDVLFAVFAQTNEHMRNAEQKQLFVTGGYLAIVAGVLSLLSGHAITILLPRSESALVYTFLALVGCCVFVYQVWCRVWKEHYLDIICRIAQTWSLPRELVPYWLRGLPKSPRRGLRKFNVDNTLVYLTALLNTAIVGLASYQATSLLRSPYNYVLAVVGSLAYLFFLVAMERLIENQGDNLTP